ncbi:class I SAM-dependent methyltransferase [Paenibacillus hodogayensis]|uniref:Class I SAM-dependent methyltransferase n=1 Tax=Paenibacillus hodogayensis TaxID=279208 RepID=A0ABV5VU85_9BACL
MQGAGCRGNCSLFFIKLKDRINNFSVDGTFIKVTGVDASKAMLSKAKEKDTEKLIQFIVGDAYNLPFLDGYFDAVFMSHLIHHMDAR